MNWRNNNQINIEHSTDHQLGELLAKWLGVEPSADFEARVWRRLAASQTTGQSVQTNWPTMLLRPAGLLAAAAAAGILLGAIAGRITLSPEMPNRFEYALAQSRTLTGTYLSMPDWPLPRSDK